MSVECLLCCFTQQFILKIPLPPSSPKSGRRSLVPYSTIVYTQLQNAVQLRYYFGVFCETQINVCYCV